MSVASTTIQHKTPTFIKRIPLNHIMAANSRITFYPIHAIQSQQAPREREEGLFHHCGKVFNYFNVPLDFISSPQLTPIIVWLSVQHSQVLTPHYFQVQCSSASHQFLISVNHFQQLFLTKIPEINNLLLLFLQKTW